MRVFFTNLGCKLNQAELERLARDFNAAGHRVAPSLDEADLHVVNTCTVTHVAARDSRKVARRGRRLNPELKTVLTGCYVESDRAEAERLAGVDLVVPNQQKEELVERVHRAFPEVVPKEIDRPLGAEGPLPVPYVPLDFGNSRALVKIEDGCNMRCSFCIIPSTRGPQRSRAVDEVVAEVNGLTARGFGEIVITGVQISSYRWQGRGLYELVATLLAKSTVHRLRLTSIAPWQFDRRLLSLFDSGRLCRHFHISLQSGSAATLRRMRRPYSPEQYAGLLEEIRHAVPGVAITTDLIVGFPGETDEEFEAGLRFLESMRFAGVHAFPYSSRPGTEAETLPRQVTHAVKRERMARVLEAARHSARRFIERQLGSEVEVLWERRVEGGWLGTSDHYLKVFCDSTEDLGGRLTRVRLQSAAGGRVRAVATAGADPARGARPAPPGPESSGPRALPAATAGGA